ncbi:site-specific DNA-methyltransferase [Caballeronia sp. ATUFL_F1_KS4A]|uniref:site-specific DNA-methyltransferase n=1 Tax=Caballeronia sp. ATUFL_F1_KS4A TaxID=2921768 RepID=UPI00202887A2|nr:site-specific DNA-methyltransferase [Caballeronia sp. ATUFL_F1_KS4A]
MTTKQNTKFQQLIAKLREIFQIDRPELDFGIYRILNARASEINDYLENRLAEKVQAALAAGNTASVQQLRAELQEAEKSAHALGVSPDGVPKVQELRSKLLESTRGASEHENSVFSHLLVFFTRYYDNGDFISQRRYKGDTYAIPYAGEEVILNWANKDQYYTKSGENFANFSFRLEDGRTVHFRLVAADTAKDNRKDNDKERRFALIEKKTVIRVDEEGDEYEEEVLPVEEVGGTSGKELIVRFEYIPVAKGTKQEALVAKAVQALLADEAIKARWLDLGARAPTEKNPQRTLLEKHLTDYTTKNTADYFIHKDLGGFLRRELDFYIKNEVIHLDDVQNAGAFADVEKNLRMIQCLRTIALELIAFMAQLEDFQKKLWLKKKFVVSCDYCITLDRVPEAFHEEIAANEKQWAQWQALGMWTKSNPGSLDDIKAQPYLMIDTALFPASFRLRLIREMGDLDADTNGVLIHGDNFQALGLLSERYRGQIDYIYIDPPYNTTENAFAYKNQYKHSSWSSLIENRLARSYPLLTPDTGVCAVAIDDTETGVLREILGQIFGQENYVSTIAVEVNPAGQNIRPNTPARSHDYFHVYARNIDTMSMRLRGLTPEEERAYKEQDEHGFYLWDNLRRRGGNSRPSDRPKQWFPLYASLKQCKVSVEPFDGCEEIFPIDPKGEKRIWRVNKDGAARFIASGDISIIEKAGRIELVKKTRMPEGKKPKTIWYGSGYSATTYGTKLLIDILGEQVFSYPKALGLVTDALSYWMGADDTVLDFFAGSGTTGHAVMALNRTDGGTRKYVLVEQGDYFDTVLKPRMQKVAYSAEWKDGKPTAPETGVSHCFKVLKIESYEDTLNNLQLRRPTGQDVLFANLPQQARDDYLLRYMLDLESRGSLLSVENFRKPFEYRMDVAVDSAGAYVSREIDLVETFNYLIGLRVSHIESNLDEGFVRVEGVLPSGENALVLWRDCDQIDYDKLAKYANRFDLEGANNPFDVIYINGDHNIPALYTPTEGDGSHAWERKLRQIESEFLSRMFSTEGI